MYNYTLFFNPKKKMFIGHAEFAKRDRREESRNDLRNNIFGKTTSGKALRTAALLTLGAGGVAAVKNKKSLSKPLDLFTTKIDGEKDKVLIKTVNGKKHYHYQRGFMGSDRKLRYDNIAKATALTGGALMVPTAAGYAFAKPEEKKEIKQRFGNTYGELKQTSKTARGWLNTLDRMERWS